MVSSGVPEPRVGAFSGLTSGPRKLCGPFGATETGSGCMAGTLLGRVAEFDVSEASQSDLPAQRAGTPASWGKGLPLSRPGLFSIGQARRSLCSPAHVRAIRRLDISIPLNPNSIINYRLNTKIPEASRPPLGSKLPTY